MSGLVPAGASGLAPVAGGSISIARPASVAAPVQYQQFGGYGQPSMLYGNPQQFSPLQFGNNITNLSGVGFGGGQFAPQGGFQMPVLNAMSGSISAPVTQSVGAPIYGGSVGAPITGGSISMAAAPMQYSSAAPVQYSSAAPVQYSSMAAPISGGSISMAGGSMAAPMGMQYGSVAAPMGMQYGSVAAPLTTMMGSTAAPVSFGNAAIGPFPQPAPTVSSTIRYASAFGGGSIVVPHAGSIAGAPVGGSGTAPVAQ